MEGLAYHIKQRFPALFRVIEKTARGVTVLRFGRRIRRARDCAVVRGSVLGKDAVMRALGPADIERLHEFLEVQPPDHLRYFRPHGFDSETLRRVLASDAFLIYGLFVGERMIAYALLKISPSGSAYRGRLVAPEWTGYGVGKFLGLYVYWQAMQARLKPRATVSRQNLRSLASLGHDYRVVAELPNDYLLIEFPPGSPDAPELHIPANNDGVRS